MRGGGGGNLGQRLVATRAGGPFIPERGAETVSELQRSASAALPCSEREQRLLGTLLRSFDAPLYMIDANTYEIVLANAAMCRDEPPWGVKCHALTHHRDTPCSGTDGPCPLEMVRRSKQPVVVEHRHYDADGRIRHYEVHALPVIDHHGQVSEMIEYNIDITERRRAERQVRAHEHSLEILVQQLQASNRELAAFASVAAHDIRSPLQSIATSAEALALSLDGPLNEPARRALAMLMRGLQRLRDTITAQYERARRDAHVEAVDVDLKQLIVELCKFQLAPEIETSKGRVRVAEPLHSVRADETQLLELLQNLISNALKFRRDPHPPEVVVRTLALDDGWVRIEVRDNGTGIVQGDQDRVFQMFARLDNPVRADGLGIGLAVCKRIVQRHGGRIGVQSTYGKGSTFWVELPG